MKQMGKVLLKSRFTTDDTVESLNFDVSKRSISVGGGDGKSGGYIGRVCEASKSKKIFDSSVWLNYAFPNVIGVFGMRGTGKSFNLGVFAECLTNISQVSLRESSPPAVVIFDVQSQFWTLSVEPNSKRNEEHFKTLSKWHLSPEAVPNVRCWTPSGTDSFLPEAVEYKISPDQLDASDWLALLEQERYSPMGQALLELLKHSDDHTPAALANGLRSSGTLPSFQHATLDSLRWRLESVASSGLIGKPGVNINEFLVPGRVSVVLLRNLQESLRSLTAATLVRLLATRMTNFHQQYKMARYDRMEAPSENLPQQLWVMMDEAHTIAPREGRTPANEPLVDYVKRGRDSGLSLVFATQQPSAVDDKLMSQVDMTFTHALGFDADVQAAVARMPTRKPGTYRRGAEILKSPGDLIRSLNPGEAILADSASQRPFIIRMRPRLSVHGGDSPS